MSNTTALFMFCGIVAEAEDAAATGDLVWWNDAIRWKNDAMRRPV